MFIGIKGSVIALNRATGEQVWVAALKGSDFVNIVVQGDTVLASCSGDRFCLDSRTGEGLWHSPLKGFGIALAVIATEGNLERGNAPISAEQRSLIVTTNLPFEQWTEVMGSERLTGALLDRLTHRVHILEANGQSYRLTDAKRRHKRK